MESEPTDEVKEEIIVAEKRTRDTTQQLPQNRPPKPEPIPDELATYFNFSETQILDKIKFDCQIDNLIFKGRFEPVFGKSFGFLKDVEHITGQKLLYPVLQSDIDALFIVSDKLEAKTYYTFEVKVASKKERIKYNNPFLLQAKDINIQEIIQLSELDGHILQRQEKLTQIENSVTVANNTFAQKLADFDAEKAAILEKDLIQRKERLKYIEDKIIDTGNTLAQKLANFEIEKRAVLDTHLLELENVKEKYHQENERVLIEQARLSELTKQTTEMESTLELLRQKVNICQNLDFLTKEEADRYLVALDQKPFTRPNNHLDFKADLNENYPDLVKAIHNYLHFEKGLIYTKFQIRNFLALLLTHDIIVLSGLSGSGKTQIVKAFAEAVGGVAKIIPVKPSWTSSDDLLGYYNPLQSSFMPTPFTEAIVEATQNPHRLYLICLDEMNLARVEYYFADFLSKLEEREHQPEIDLYAKHEEEMFAAEFKTMLMLIESAIGTQSVNSWVDFLTNDSIRTRFFELLGASEKDTVLQIHANMKKRLVNILKFPATLKIPANVRFIGAINVDETTHYFSPKILDRVHIVKFENPLIFEEEVRTHMEQESTEGSYSPVYIDPKLLVRRMPYPSLSQSGQKERLNGLINLNKEFLISLNIDFGVRSLRQAANYYEQYQTCSIDLTEFNPENMHIEDIQVFQEFIEKQASNVILNQKVLTRFVFDGDEFTKGGEKKLETLEKMAFELPRLMELEGIDTSRYRRGNLATQQLLQMIASARANNNQVNFFA